MTLLAEQPLMKQITVRGAHAQAALRPPLLALLGDADGELRARAVQFWHSALPRSLGGRLRALLADSLDQPGAWVGEAAFSRHQEPCHAKCKHLSPLAVWMKHAQQHWSGCRVLSGKRG